MSSHGTPRKFLHIPIWYHTKETKQVHDPAENQTIYTYSCRDSVQLRRWNTQNSVLIWICLISAVNIDREVKLGPLCRLCLMKQTFSNQSELIYDVSVWNNNQWRSLTSNGPWLKNTIWSLAKRIKKKDQGENEGLGKTVAEAKRMTSEESEKERFSGLCGCEMRRRQGFTH